jgi:RNA polymerase sigma factor (sigma-70 family)
MEEASADLMARWRQGDQEAARQLFRRYAERLYALAKSRLSSRMARHVDPEDVVQSAYRSFFSGARAGRFALRRSGDLWRLLAAITLHKLRRQVERHTTGKRDVGREGAPADASEAPEAAPDREPTPEEAAALLDTLESLFRGLDPAQRRMVELRLQGFGLDEIAAQVGRSERTVRRLLELVKERLRNHKDEE